MTQIKRQAINKIKLNPEIVIEFNQVGKKYILHHEKPTFVENVERTIHFQKKEEYWAIRDLNLQIHRGEKIGIYGTNGVGKTTLLKLIAGLTVPTVGKITTQGKIVSLIDLEAGFHPDLTGQENIYLNGLIVGMSKKEISNKLPAIVKFADIGNFITAPLSTYSSGMKLRLGFSVAIHTNADIFLLDEVLNMGDKDFRYKSRYELNQLIKSGVTILMISQFINDLRNYCDTILQIYK